MISKIACHSLISFKFVIFQFIFSILKNVLRLTRNSKDVGDNKNFNFKSGNKVKNDSKICLLKINSAKKAIPNCAQMTLLLNIIFLY
jgi:hypothetical protein